MSLTPQERAENILTLLNFPAKWDRKNGIPESAYKAVLAEIAEAEREAVTKVPVNAYFEGYARAKEQATRIAEELFWAHSQAIIDEIRAMQPEEKK